MEKEKVLQDDKIPFFESKKSIVFTGAIVGIIAIVLVALIKIT